MLLMDKALGYLISAGIAGFGVWIIAHALGSGTSSVWMYLGILPVIVGVISFYQEARSS
jgi:hypothetical protein